MASEQFSLCWDNFHKNMSSGMNSLLENEDLVDVTLAVEGKYLKAHKMVLSVCSPYFKELFKTNPCKHPIVFMKDVSYVALSDLLQFMYQGEVQVSQENLTTFIKTAEALQIKGLTGDGSNSTENDVDQEDKSATHILEDTKSEYKSIPAVSRPKKNPPPALPTPPAKRQRSNTSSSDVGSSSNIVTKTEPITNTPTTEFVQFKMEPYDQSQTISIQDDDEQFGEGLEDTVGDETEDYSMMEGNEEEPQAGTSTEGTGEGQGFERIVVNSLSKLVATVEHHSMMLMELNQRAITSATNKLSPPPNVPTFPLQTLESFQEFECLISTDPAVWEYMVKRLSILGGSDSESLTRSILRYLLSNEVAVFFNWKGREKLAFENLKVMELIVAAVRVNNSSTQVNELKISNTVKVWLKQSKHRMQSSRKPK